ncbi:MAG: hypothetical protein HQ494_10865 [Rhodospirillales bacterium]|nr:hypothetical protein [Rhodospirillales bacterium]
MLIEWLRHLTTPCSPRLKRMGYLKELIAIQSRHQRCRDAWAPHLEHCKRIILEATTGIPHRRAVVLGSGLLLDIPLGPLCDMFGEVVLVDILHLPAVIKRARLLANVRLVDADCSGLADATWDHVCDGRTGPLPVPVFDDSFCQDSDLIVSANLLTQLPLAPLGWVQGMGEVYSKDETRTFARAIIDHHLEFLKHQTGRVCLLSETERQILQGGEVLEVIDPLFGAALPMSGLKWNWNIAPRPEITPHIDLRFRMTGIADLKTAGGLNRKT